MKKSTLKTIAMLFVGILISFSACNKDDDDDLDNTYEPPEHYKGDTEGSITVDGTTTEISGGSTVSDYGFSLHPRNMTPANSYPSVTITMDAEPTEDSTYNLLYISTSLSVKTTENSADKYWANEGDLVVSVSTDSIVASWTDLVAEKMYTDDTIVISGWITYYK